MYNTIGIISAVGITGNYNYNKQYHRKMRITFQGTIKQNFDN